eukprot:Blabericola_migrator_1__13224@NODE_917_length_6065_cov_346_982161_g638_i0_p1_GENE_NODE_917_length_6065_cov_346_982161_g638_i0NODE_917_length_6065_cov_346_982161_g638_i0_p1_ORF_typecomplete_len462_score99_50Thioredoxin/PF00085_20/5_3e30Thioredoxin/PF00085_20/0_0021Thioredoxin/PF00085_20/4_9e24Thioredoxin_6/PF13848_6/85Thioredoxin_6/PF13848_6/9_7e06Thioredoxin_6/PF13848_6/8_3e22Thioredoxin_6/PF13848_6/1_3e02Thioredoxin_6/PF13848_6/0_039Calsequestrin/PF01216_17/7_7e18Calsequestrin/PF01216_17/6_3e02
MKVWSFLALTLTTFAADTDTHVHQLTTQTFNGFLKQHPVSLVKFYAPWCGHCQKLAPAYEAAAAELKKRGSIPLADVDATVETELAKKYEVKGFPTLLLFRDGKPEPYGGGRSEESIVEWVLRMTGPAVRVIESLEAIDSLDKIHFVATVTGVESHEAKLFEAAANAERLSGDFYMYVDKQASPAVSVHRPSEDTVSTKIHSKEQLVAWIKNEAFPYFGPVSGENYGNYAARSPNWFWFASHAEDYEKYGPIIRKVSKNYRTDFNFVWLDSDTLRAHAENALGIKEFPGITLVYEDSKYRFESQTITEKALTKFIESVKAGKAKKFLKSEPVPETNNEAVKAVVGQNFSDMILKKDRDVFLKIYAPWCGHCKKLAPVWEELAEKTKESKHFMVAKFDGTANEPDVPGFEYQGFPTLYFVKAGSKTPIAYDGERTLDALLAFAKKHATFALTISETATKEEL